MKIIALIENTSPGGGFNQSLASIIQMKRICENQFEFSVVTTSIESFKVMKNQGISAIHIKLTFWDKLLTKFMLISFFVKVINRCNPQWVYPIEKRLIELGADLIYFGMPSDRPRNIRSLNFIYTVWDHAHRDTPEFPEVSKFGEFLAREYIYQRVLPHAFLVLTESQLLADNIARRYGVDGDRLLPMPLSLSPTLMEKSSLSTNAILEKYKLLQGYFFYPAQFWPHKNHIRILEALIILREEGSRPMIIFTGGDQGNLQIVKHFIQVNELQRQVRLLGFVPSNDMHGLYEGCRAVVMPTYFGPTNIPPLEAWMIGKPLIYSCHLKEQAQDAALLIDPDEADDIATAIRTCFDERICKELVQRGHKRLAEIQKDREQAESKLLAKLIQFEKRLRCWKL